MSLWQPSFNSKLLKWIKAQTWPAWKHPLKYSEVGSAWCSDLSQQDSQWSHYHLMDLIFLTGTWADQTGPSAWNLTWPDSFLTLSRLAAYWCFFFLSTGNYLFATLKYFCSARVVWFTQGESSSGRSEYTPSPDQSVEDQSSHHSTGGITRSHKVSLMELP